MLAGRVGEECVGGVTLMVTCTWLQLTLLTFVAQIDHSHHVEVIVKVLNGCLPAKNADYYELAID